MIGDHRMARRPAPLTLGQLARAGFHDLSSSRDALLALAAAHQRSPEALLAVFTQAADPDAALTRFTELLEHHPGVLAALSEREWGRLALLLGASPALGLFFVRHPDRLAGILTRGGRLIDESEAHTELLAAVHGLSGVAGAEALRVRYRELLAEVLLYDLADGAGAATTPHFTAVTLTLSGLATAALEAALAVARASLIAGDQGPKVAADRVAATRVAVIAMGKCGAQELNVVSDVDVMFIAEPAADADAVDLDSDAVLRIATRLASEAMRAIHDPAIEPPLWQVDANLRPEGRQGPLVRSLASMLNYYERWAKTWEFQALLKARAAAGDRALGEEFVARTRSMVWASSTRDDFVGSVQRMRERVTEHIDPEHLDRELKLGPGGLRDIEFSVQLLQLVHGQRDERLRVRGTLPALQALVDGGYVARADGDRFAQAYRTLRVIEHRLQMRELRRTALMPRDPEELRVLARATGVATTAEALNELWESTKIEVRQLHLKIFYAPLLGAVAALPDEDLVLGGEQARERLTGIGFRDPDGALRHLAALTAGTSRAARIQRNLLPVLLQWIASGTDPDYGLLAFRRVSEASRDTPWYLRLLRDGSEAAERLCHVLSSSRFAAGLLETIPEAVAWLERDEALRPVALTVLLEEMRALVSRRETVDSAATALRAVHRREILRLAMGKLVGVLDDREVSIGLDAAHTALLDGLLLAVRHDEARRTDEGSAGRDAAVLSYDLALIALGRYGGRELGFASDIDVIAVTQPRNEHAGQMLAAGEAQRAAERTVAELRRLVSDPRFPVDLDFDLRPEGKQGVIVRSLESYRAYYARWSLTWEAQALLRARAVAGDAELGRAFEALADEIRYPTTCTDAEVREIRRLKARVEAERLPQGAEPRRHLKLGPGGISDVEWLVQLLQLKNAAQHPQLRTVSTLGALTAAKELGLLSEESCAHLESAWVLASAIRSAAKLWSGRAADVLPVERGELEGIAGVLGMPSGSTIELEEAWFAAARRARQVVEREFFGYDTDPDEYPVILA